MRTYHARIVGLCPALDGKRVEVVEDDHPLVCVSSYVHTATVVRFLGSPVKLGAWSIPVGHLQEELDVPEEELALDNPFGDVLETESWVGSDTAVAATRYSEAVHISIRNTKTRRTIADRTLWGDSGRDMWERLQMSIARGDEPIDFVFEMKV